MLNQSINIALGINYNHKNGIIKIIIIAVKGSARRKTLFLLLTEIKL